MNELEFLKRDLQILNTAQDEYLTMLLKSVERKMEIEGITKDDSDAYASAKVEYAAYLFRKRASKETTMPRFLRYDLNNLKLHQNAKK